MGLDYSIELKIRNKKTEEFTRVELGYWRKCYSVRDVLHDYITAAADKEDGDWYAETKNPEVLDEVISKILDALSNKKNRMWADSLWGTASAMIITAKQLPKLIAGSQFLEAYYSEWDEEYFDSGDFCYALDVDEDLLIDVMKNKDNYSLTIESFNSY